MKGDLKASSSRYLHVFNGESLNRAGLQGRRRFIKHIFHSSMEYTSRSIVVVMRFEHFLFIVLQIYRHYCSRVVVFRRPFCYSEGRCVSWRRGVDERILETNFVGNLAEAPGNRVRKKMEGRRHALTRHRFVALMSFPFRISPQRSPISNENCGNEVRVLRAFTPTSRVGLDKRQDRHEFRTKIVTSFVIGEKECWPKAPLSGVRIHGIL